MYYLEPPIQGGFQNGIQKAVNRHQVRLRQQEERKKREMEKQTNKRYEEQSYHGWTVNT